MFPAFVQKILTPVCFLLSFTCFSQQQPTPRTLLWRITGKGLQQPSYVYGTMHLQDKRLFRFGDSVYHAIETTQGLATEIDFQEAVDSLFNNREKDAEKDKQLAKQKIKLDRSKLNPTAQSLLRKFGITGNIISKKELKDIHEFRTQALLQRGEMPTIVDGFLLGIAQRQGKWTGGIEDVDDQLDIRDEMGSELEPASVLQSEKDFREAVDNMIKIYVAQDLDKIDQWSNREFDGKTRDAILVKRNVKMAWRMDSLSAVRPTFFAVGAAHLPGDSGVVQLLRNRGLRVEPVFSAKQVPGDDYAAHLKQKEWKEVKGSHDAYTVQMPGIPSDVNKPGEAPQMKMFFDLTTMTVYMAGHVNGYDAGARSLDKALQETAKNVSGEDIVASPASIVHRNLQGKETFATKDGYTFRMQVFHKDNRLFMLMAGSPKKEMVTGSDADRFFTSFVPGETAAKQAWKSFSLPGKAFAVRMPGNPEPQKDVDDKVADNPSWVYTTYYSIDPQTDYFYLLQVRQVKAGYNIQNDSTYIAALQEDYESRFDTVKRFDITYYNGYPAAYMEHEVKQVSGAYKSLHVIRGNQVYILMGGAPKGSNMADIDSFLHSLVLLPYEPVVWKKAEAAGFSTHAPAPFKKTEPDSTSNNRHYFVQYTSYNEKDAVSYAVQKSVFSPTYWAVDDSTLMEEKLAFYKGEQDTLLQKTWVQNGNLKGLDLLVKPHGHESLKKIRLLVNRDTLYTLFSIIQAREWKDEHQQFFSEFRLQNEVPPTIFTSKAAHLLQAMTTSDSTEFENVLEDFESVSFRKEDLPLLHKALLENYRDSDEYNSTNSKLLQRILPLADNTTLAFVKGVYPKQEGEKEVNKYRLLQLLAQLKSSESFAVLKPFLLADLPGRGNAILLQRPLLDSLPLTATLFPELLQKADDSLLAPVIAAVANQLLNNNLLASTTLKAYKQPVLNGVANELKLLQQEAYEPWELIRWAQLLGWLNEPEGNAVLQKMLTHKDVSLKQASILALLKNNHPVPASPIAQVAADRGTRLYFYETLQQMGRLSIFPALYASQKSLAESELYNLLAEDYDDFTLTYIGQRTTSYEGAPRLFHLFKVRMAYEDEVKRDYLGVAGPYPVAGREKILYGDATGVYGDERFQLQKTDKLLKNYLLSLKPAEK